MLVSFFFCFTLSKRWAVLIAGSNTFNNYRHQADISYIAKMLMERGYDQENIINMQYNDVVNDKENIFPGTLYHTLDHINVYNESLITHQGKNITAQAIYDVLTGDGYKSLNSTEDDDVLIYYNDHGSISLLAVPDGNGDPIFASDLEKAFNKMEEKKMYKRLLFVIEACESGSIIPFIKTNNTVVITASGPAEPSSSAVYDEELDNFLSNEFTTTFLNAVINLPSGTINDIFKDTLKNMEKSTPHIGGNDTLFDIPMSTFFGISYINEFRQRNPLKKGKLVPQRQAKRFMLEKSKRSHADPKVRTRAALDLLRIEAESMKLSTILGDINNLLANRHNEYNRSDNNSDFAVVVKYFLKKYGNVDQDDLGLLNIFENLIRKYSVQQITKAIDTLIG